MESTLNLEVYKADIHKILISKLDLEKLSRVNSSQARQVVAGIVNEIIAEQRVPLSFEEQERIQEDLLDEFFGRYVSLNSFTETVLTTIQRKEIMRWPARTGRRQIV